MAISVKKIMFGSLPCINYQAMENISNIYNHQVD